MKKYAIVCAESAQFESKSKILILDPGSIHGAIEPLLKEGTSYFLCSAKPGAEAQIALFLLEKRAEGFPIFLELVIEDELIFTTWNETDRDIFFHVCEHCDKETLLAHCPTSNTKSAYFHYMEKASNNVLLLPSCPKSAS